MLGECYYNGNGVNKDEAEAVKWYSKASEQGNYDAVEQLRELAGQGNADAQYRLGDCYYYGWGVVNKDEAEAVKWYNKAAEQGNVTAQYQLGECYYYGDGVNKDYAEAVKWYSKAAKQGSGYAVVKRLRELAEHGNADAQCMLGYCYYHGNGVDDDRAEAIKWWRKAAEQGNKEAIFTLGAMGF